MQKSKVTRKTIETENLQMYVTGQTHRVIAELYGLVREPVKKLIRMYREKQDMLRKGYVNRPKGRTRKDGQHPKHDVETYGKWLRMENKQLQDFL